MNTPAHLIFGAAAFARPEKPNTLTAALAGALAPDLSLYLMVGVSIWILDVPARTVFGDYYYSDAWQSVFAVDNSFILWGVLLAVALWRKWTLVTAFAGAAVLHLCFDFPLHTHDARMHFWPVSDWVFQSPISYWDNRAHAGIVGSMEVTMSVGLAALLATRFQRLWPRLVLGVLAVAEVFSSGIWRFIF